jgi:hypothetical protein
VKCASTLPAGQVACSHTGFDYNPNATSGPYTDAGGGTAGAQPACFPSATSTTACLAGADLTQVAELPGASLGGSGTPFQGRGIRITDRFNGYGLTQAGTVTDVGFPVPIDCIPTSQGNTGSTCGVNTTANALAPGSVRDGNLAVWQVGEIAIKDSGPDGIRGNSDDELFEVQGFFLP